VVFRHCLTDVGDDLIHQGVPEISEYLMNNNQVLGVVRFNCKRCAPSRFQGRTAKLDGLFYIFRIEVAAPDDNDILDPSLDEELSLF